MGIYDRDYLKDEPLPFHRRVGRSALVSIMILCGFVWILQLMTQDQRGGGSLTEALGCRAVDLFSGFPEIWRPFTALFAHSTNGAFHLLGNLFFLWLFGREVEQEHGGGEFWRFFLTAGALSVLGECISLQFMGRENAMVYGASGSVMGMMAVFVALAPSAPILIFFFTVPRWGIGLVFLLMDMRGVTSSAGGNVAHLAHLVGAFYGFLYVIWDLRWERLLPKRRARKKLARRKEPRRESPPEPVKKASEDSTSARIDALLAKISVLGMEGLSEEERSFLNENSKNYRSPG